MHALASNATAAFAVATAASTTPVSLSDFVASLFAVDLREKLAAETTGDNSDAAFAWGM
jgi:hypothetical protein